MVFTYGLLVIIANGLYLLFSILVGISIYFLLRKKWWIDRLNFLNPLMRWKGLISTTAFLVVILAPFYDLIIQMGIKTYYQNFKMNDTIYAYPEKDENGKIESLTIINHVIFSSERFNDSEERKLLNKRFYEIFIDKFHKKVNLFVELEADDNTYYRFYLTQQTPQFIKINKEESIYSLEKGKTNFFNFYQEEECLYKDIKNNKLLAKGWKLHFIPNKNNFRNTFLFWKSANGVPFMLDGIENCWDFNKELYGLENNYVNKWSKR